MTKTIGYIAFFLLFLLAAVMGWATWQEHLNGSVYAVSHFYGTPWFNLLWAWLALAGGYYIVQKKLYKKLSVLMLHLALLIILFGAMITRFNGKTGMIRLRENAANHTFACQEAGRSLPLPFSLELKTFRIEYYPGTSSPSNYVSIVNVKDFASGEVFEKEISMNNILKYKGYRFYQSSFDEDMKGSVLSVNQDGTGIAFTYAGYYLLFISMLWVLFDKRGRFRKLVAKSKKSFPVALLFFIFLTPSAQANDLLTPDSLTLDREQTDCFSSVWVNYQGRICPLQTLAVDFATKLTGKPKYKSANAEQFLLGWIFFPEEWQQVTLFDVKHPELKALINPLGKACLYDFFHPEGNYKLEPYRKSMYGGGKQTAFLKEAARIDEKIQLISMLQQGHLLKLFPIPTDNGVRWFAPSDVLPEQTDKMQQLLTENFFSIYYEYIQQNKKADALSLIHSLHHFQQKTAGNVLPSENRLKAELLSNRIPIFSLLFKICLTIGCIGMFLFIRYAVKNKESRTAHTVFYGLLIIVLILLTVGIALRGYISGRLPVGNGYETMLFISWSALLTGLLFRRSSFLMTNFSLLLAGFTLLVAHIGAINPQITPLVPVLQSPLLSIHVSLIMIAYGLCGFMALNSLTSFILLAFSKKNPDTWRQVKKMKEMSEMFMFPATFLIGAGIFIGAIWANVSWGRYWGWDPKEVWALITFILMSSTFHNKTLTWFRNSVFYHLFVLVIFAAVLMTYFGVNYILGGMHSYAGE